MTKVCNWCRIEKNYDCFTTSKTNKDNKQTYCKDCKKRYDKIYKLKNADRIKIRDKQYWILNRDKSRINMANYRLRHPDRVKIQNKKTDEKRKEKKKEQRKIYTITHKEQLKIQRQRYRKRNILANGYCSDAQLRARIAYYGNCCWICRGPYQSIDHIIALNNGGTNWPANLAPSCLRCNSKKGARRLKDLNLSEFQKHNEVQQCL